MSWIVVLESDGRQTESLRDGPRRGWLAGRDRFDSRSGECGPGVAGAAARAGECRDRRRGGAAAQGFARTGGAGFHRARRSRCLRLGRRGGCRREAATPVLRQRPAAPRPQAGHLRPRREEPSAGRRRRAADAAGALRRPARRGRGTGERAAPRAQAAASDATQGRHRRRRPAVEDALRPRGRHRHEEVHGAQASRAAARRGEAGTARRRASEGRGSRAGAAKARAAAGSAAQAGGPGESRRAAGQGADIEARSAPRLALGRQPDRQRPPRGERARRPQGVEGHRPLVARRVRQGTGARESTRGARELRHPEMAIPVAIRGRAPLLPSSASTRCSSASRSAAWPRSGRRA